MTPEDEWRDLFRALNAGFAAAALVALAILVTALVG